MNYTNKECVNNADYSHTKSVDLDFNTAVEKVKEALSTEGFGVLVEIDIKATMQEKIGAEYDNYVILGACNPVLADRALRAEKEIGLFLPCNVIVYEDAGEVRVSTVLPVNMMRTVGNASLDEVALNAQERLVRAISSV